MGGFWEQEQADFISERRNKRRRKAALDSQLLKDVDLRAPSLPRSLYYWFHLNLPKYFKNS